MPKRSRRRKPTSSPETSAVVASLVNTGGGTLRLVLEDVRRSENGWTAVGIFTSRDFDARSLRTMRLRASAAREVGENLMLRLVAHDARARARETARTFRGAWVAFNELPSWVRTLPPESRRVFRFCRGRPYRVTDVDPDGLLILDVSREVDSRFGGTMNDLRIEPEWVTRVRRPPTKRAAPRAKR